MSKLDKDQVIAQFTAAYERAHNKQPDIEAKGGWYSVDGGKNMRLAQLKDMADELEQGTAPASGSSKPANKKAKPARKEGFSVKAFWNDKIVNDNDGSILPR
ncbi:hypothetical protein OCL06_06450 [Alteromonas sp. ASW11-19]|uniref:Uncharacterized protein n=1 Tax=Alteromonas salexigens TaxID=2982530 RepID=A0ABT2VLN7_9ALTE|nr:hypothetical protein [Alteromonas salexigens]MCU7554232.1 hypothetical protein [Alteromonas salexigens]